MFNLESLPWLVVVQKIKDGSVINPGICQKGIYGRHLRVLNFNNKTITFDTVHDPKLSEKIRKCKLIEFRRYIKVIKNYISRLQSMRVTVHIFIYV